jgi:large conductance mechanosensitive channel
MANLRSRQAATGFVKEFQEFIMKGNVVDLAVAVVIGGAFGKIVTSFVESIVMPLVSVVIPGGEWRNAKLVLGSVTDAKGKVVENAVLIGSFFGSIVDFLVIALVIFLMIRTLAKFKRQQEVMEEATAGPDTQERLVGVLERLEQKI